MTTERVAPVEPFAWLDEDGKLVVSESVMPGSSFVAIGRAIPDSWTPLIISPVPTPPTEPTELAKRLLEACEEAGAAARCLDETGFCWSAESVRLLRKLADEAAAALSARRDDEPTDEQISCAVRAWFGDTDTPPVSKDFINRMRNAIRALRAKEE